MVEDDIAAEVGSQPGRVILLLLFLQNVIDTVDGHAGLAHFGKDASQATDWPDQGGVIRDKRHKGADRDVSAYRFNGAKHQNGHDLKAGKQIAEAPIHAHNIAEIDPHISPFVVLLVKPVDFIGFPAKGANNPHTGQVLLHGGGQGTLCLIRFAEPFGDFTVKNKRIGDDNGDKSQRHPGEFGVHRKHQAHGKNNQEHNADNLQHLTGNKVAHDLNIRGAALNDITGLVFHMPVIRELLNVGEKLFPDPLGKPFGALCGKGTAEKGTDSGAKSDEQNGRDHQPKMLADILSAAGLLNQRQNRFGKLKGLFSDDRVHHCADHLWRERIKHRIQHGSNNRQNKI